MSRGGPGVGPSPQPHGDPVVCGRGWGSGWASRRGTPGTSDTARPPALASSREGWHR